MESFVPPEPRLISFVLRFVYEQAQGEETAPSSGERQGWYGIVRHVQSSAERHFTRWEDAAAFVAMYVDLGKEAGEANDADG